MGLGSRSLVKDVLRTTMVKRASDLPVFDELFDVFFTGLGDAIREVGEEGASSVADSSEGYQQLLERLEELLRQDERELSEIARALLEHDDGTLERKIREALERAKGSSGGEGRSREGRLGHALGFEIGLADVSRELGQLADDLDSMGLDPELAARLRELIRQRLADLADLLKRAAKLEASREERRPGDPTRLGELGEKSFYYLNEDEIRRMKEAVTRLAQRLKNIVSIKRTRAKRGTFDLQRTLRHNTQFGGVPFDVQFDRRKRHRPQIVILCDVSDSVRNVSRFMLQFVYSLQDLYSKVRSYIFVAEIGEVTRLFEENDINAAVDQALRGDIINVFAHSDFGKAFKAFHQDWLSSINRRTTVIILGDARNNYNLPHEWVLRDIQVRAKQVLWLNPESRNTWGFGDSEMDRYSPFCSVVEECRNLNQLYRVIDKLLV
ncbi:MAG: VWA domain-containing protein [Deltaproteobacteria bacterium]|nr:VWA domain-containing protein [Deltaproteobacteria bacterium]